MSELDILCNEQNILCNSIKYYVTGAPVNDSISYSSVTFADVSHEINSFSDIDYLQATIFLYSVDGSILLDSAGNRLKVLSSEISDTVEY